MSIILALLYPLAIQYERGGYWRVLTPVTFIALVIDIFVNYTELALVTLDFPQYGEFTFSQRLKRLKYDHGWRGYFAHVVIKYLDYFDPHGRHI